MEVKVVQADRYQERADAVLLFLFEADEELLEPTARYDAASNGLLRAVLARGEFRGEHLDQMLIPAAALPEADNMLLVGLGRRDDFTALRLREACGQACRFLRERRLQRAVVHAAQGKPFPLDASAAGGNAVLGAMLGLYQFTEYRTKKREEIKEFAELTVLYPEGAEVEAEVSRARTIGSGVYLARDLVTLPGNVATPTYLAERAKEVAQAGGMRFRTINMAEAENLGMGSFLAVASGSDEPAVIAVMEYRPPGVRARPVVLVGKGITFDSGGISIKPSEHMEMMKHDMAGAAAVIGTMQVAAALELPLPLVGIIPCTENLPSGKAYKPGDVITSMSGQTIEVISTDAEGRMILVDAFTYAGRYKPQAMVDLATLTGACIVALGDGVAGLMGNDDRLIRRVQRAADASGERVWPLPLWESYREMLKSDIADLKNAGSRKAGAIFGGFFLKEFVPANVPWAHLDIAGTAWEEKDRPLVPKGATGMGVQLLVSLLEKWRPLRPQPRAKAGA